MLVLTKKFGLDVFGAHFPAMNFAKPHHVNSQGSIVLFKGASSHPLAFEAQPCGLRLPVFV